MAQEYAISLKNIQKSFGGVTVLNNVSFDLEKGKVHALVGQNGAGKSTLMKILTGVYTCDSGEIWVAGKQVDIHSYSDAVKNGISLIFQELSLIPTLTVTENIFLNREITRGKFVDKKAMEAKTIELLQSLDIDVDINAKISELDVGVCQMIEIAKALSIDAKVLILDEPTASLSDKETTNLFRLISGLKAKGVSMVYISHRMSEIFQVCDYITVLRNGSIVTTKPTSEFTMESLIEDMIGKKVAGSAAGAGNALTKEGKVILKVENMKLNHRLHGVSFELREGEILGLAGLMGSGRTEIVESLFGLNPSATGNISLQEQSYQMKDCQHAIDCGIALIPEDRRREGLVLAHTVGDNLNLPILKRLRRKWLLSSKKIHQLAERSISEFSIKTPSENTTIFNLSGGNQQKVVVGKWLNCQPNVLLLDEPTAGVDIGSKNEIIAMLKDFVGKDRAAIYISSDILELMSACDRFLILQNGKITGEYTHDEISSEGVLQYAIQRAE